MQMGHLKDISRILHVYIQQQHLCIANVTGMLTSGVDFLKVKFFVDSIESESESYAMIMKSLF